jgi:hypothetical protein
VREVLLVLPLLGDLRAPAPAIDVELRKRRPLQADILQTGIVALHQFLGRHVEQLSTEQSALDQLQHPVFGTCTSLYAFFRACSSSAFCWMWISSARRSTWRLMPVSLMRMALSR